MVSDGKEEAWLWLCSQQGLYYGGIQKILGRFGDAQAAYSAGDEAIRECPGLSLKIKNELAGRRREKAFLREYHKWGKEGIHFISAAHEKFPERLRNIPESPFGLFIKGELPCPFRPAVAVVGGRKCTSYGKNISQELGRKLAEHGVEVISGMAYGIDGFAQQAALDAGGASFAVLGSGVDICYPISHRGLYGALADRGGLISEFPPGSPPAAYHFPMRNRIISGLADVVVVIEARMKSGSLITADFALEQGRDVYALPGRSGDELSAGSNRLIAQGAGVLLSVPAFLEELGYGSADAPKIKKCNIGLETNEILVYSCVDLQPKSLQELVTETKASAAAVAEALIRLELKGFIKEVWKNYYILRDE